MYVFSVKRPFKLADSAGRYLGTTQLILVLVFFGPCVAYTHILFITGGCPRRLGLETRTWRGVPNTSVSHATGRYDWQWDSTLRNVCSHPWYSFLRSLHDHLCDACIVFALLGFLSPSNRGSLATVMMVCWSFFGGCVVIYVFFVSTVQLLANSRISGYYSSRIYASLGGKDRRKTAFVTATVLPTCVVSLATVHNFANRMVRLVFIIIFLLNAMLLIAGSSGAVPFCASLYFMDLHDAEIFAIATMLLIVVLWFGISAPLSSIGYYLGSKQGVRNIWSRFECLLISVVGGLTPRKSEPNS